MNVSSRTKTVMVFVLGMLIAFAAPIAQADQSLCPETIRLLGNSPQGSKVQGRLPGPNYPAYVMIKGTSDIEPVRGQSGIWISRDRYFTPAMTLVLMDENLNVIHECSYDADGVLLPPHICAEFILLEVTHIRIPEVGNFARVNWFVSLEDGVTEYLVQHSINPTGSWSTVGNIPAQQLGDYVFLNSNMFVGRSYYRIVATGPGCESVSQVVPFDF